MMLLFDIRLVLRKLGEKRGSTIDDTIKKIYADREVGAKDHCADSLSHDPLDLFAFVFPAGRPLDKRYWGGDAGHNILPDGRCGREIYCDIGATQLFS